MPDSYVLFPPPKKIAVGSVLEKSHREILREMEERMANKEAVLQMEENMNKMDSQLKDISLKLEEAAVELRKEKAVNRSASKINEVKYS